jgi:DNA-binding PadR family transcriptional regulator
MVSHVTQHVRLTTGVAAVLAVFLDDPAAGRYGLELMRMTGQPSGTLYPILTRLQDAGWLSADWEDIDASAEGRPARRYYRLTAEGVTVARTELAALSARLRPGRAGRRRAEGATGSMAVGW